MMAEQTMKPLFVSFDFFHAGIYSVDHAGARSRGDRESYAHENPYVYVVPSAYVLRAVKQTPDGPVPVPGTESFLTFEEYLKAWTDSSENPKLRFVTADRKTINEIYKDIPGQQGDPDIELERIPVPFPRGTSLSLALKFKQKDREVVEFSRSHVIGAPDEPYRLDPKGWFRFAAQNYIEIPITEMGAVLVGEGEISSAADVVTTAQVKEVLDWTSVFLQGILRKSEGERSDVEKAILTIVPGVTTETVAEVLRGGVPFKGWDIVRLLRRMPMPPPHDELSLGPHDFTPPKPVYSPKQLQQLGELYESLKNDPAEQLKLFRHVFGDALGDGDDTYVEFLGREMGSKYQRAVETGNAKLIEEVVNNLKQGIADLFSYGERLRWPKPHFKSAGPDNKDLMILRADIGDGWCITNAHSLLGQVFRVGPLDHRLGLDELTVSTFELNGAPPERFDGSVDDGIAREVAEGIGTLANELMLSAGTEQKYSAKLERDRKNQQGLFSYVPSSVAGDTAAGLKSPEGKQVVRVPTSLLDALEKHRRISFLPAYPGRSPDKPRRNNAFRTESSPRRLLDPNKLFTNGEYILEPDKSQGHKYRPSMTFKVQVRRIPMLGLNESAKAVYEVSLANILHKDDHLAFHNRLLSAIGNGRSGAPCQLWISQLESDGKTVGTPQDYDLAERFIKLNGTESNFGTDKNGQTFFRIIDNETVSSKKLEKLLENVPDAQNGAEKAVHTVDLVMGVGRRSSFNVLEVLKQKEFEEQGLIFHPNSVFTTKLSLSAERIHERFNLVLDPAPPPQDEDGDLAAAPSNGVEGILDDFANFNKLRLYLEAPDKLGTPAISLTNPAALQPLSLRDKKNDLDDYLQVHEYPEWSTDNPHFSYWIPHQFSEEIIGNEEDPDTDLGDEDSTEVGRYLVRQLVGEKWALNGHIENSYSYRVWLDNLNIDLPLSDDIRHLAGVVNRQETEVKTKNGQEVKDTKPVSPALVFTHVVNDDGTNERLILRLNRTYAEEALFAYDNSTIDPATGKFVSSGKRPAQLRDLYDALMDIRRCATGGDPDDDVDTGAIRLVLERWNFDNNKSVPRADAFRFPEMEREFPDIVGNLLFRDCGTYDLPASKIAPWTELLTDSFAGRQGFCCKLEKAIDDPDHPAFENIVIPLGVDGPWDWTHNDAGNTSVSQSTNMLRLGMIVRRPKSMVSSQLSAGIRPVLLKEKENEPDRLPRVNEQRDSKYRSELEAAATDATKRYLNPKNREIHAGGASRLHKSFHWVRSTPFDTEDEDPSGIPKPSLEKKPALEADLPATRRRRLFGEIVDFVDFPAGMRSRVSNTVDLYYVLFGFLPVARHPHFIDAQTSGEFLQYLIELLSAIVTGNRLEGFGVDVSRLDGKEFLELKFRAEMIRDRLVDVLVKDFVRRVDDREGLLGHDKPVSEEAFALFDKVDKQVEALMTGNDNRTIPDAFKAALKRDLSLFNWAKALGVGVFDKETFSERLYSLMLHKKVREDRIVSGSLPGGKTDDTKSNQLRPLTYPHFLGRPGDIDTSELPHRFFLEILDDKRFDHDFEIAETTYSEDPQAGRRMIARGGAYGRTAENLIEMTDTYPVDYEAVEAKPLEPRNVEVNVIHYNPEWQYRMKGDPNGKPVKKYVLPSRDAPEVPQVLEPDLDEIGDDNDRTPNPWFSEFPPENVDGKDPHSQFIIRIKELLVEGRKNRLEEWEFKPKIPQLDGSVVLRPIPGSLYPDKPTDAGAPNDGWYHVDSYLTHYTFVVDGDEESRQADGSGDMFDGFQNDTFVIEVDSREKPFRDDDQPDVKPFDGGAGLRDWFVHRQTLVEQGAKKSSEGTSESPNPLSLVRTLNEIEAWCLEPEKLDSVLEDNKPPGDPPLSILRPRRRPRVTTSDEDVEQRVTARYTMRDKGRLVVDGLKQDGVSGKVTGLGSVVAVDAFRMYTPTEDGAEQDQGRMVLRVTVLDDPWRHTRCRMRIMRNDVDVDGDIDSDINPDFVMASPYSDWAIYPPYFIIYTEDEVLDFAEPLRALTVIPDDTNASAENWSRATAAAIKDPRDAIKVNFGPMLNAVLRKEFVDDEDKKRPYWNTDKLIRGSISIDGVVGQLLDDLHPRLTVDGRDSDEKIEERHDIIIKQNLIRDDGSRFPATEEGMAQLTSGFRKDLIRTDMPNLIVTWYDEQGVPLMEINWPIVWQHGDI